MNSEKRNIGIMGAAFHTGNMGVSALAASMIKIISTLQPDSTFSFFISHNKRETQSIEIINKTIEVKINNYRLSPKSKLNDHIFWILILAILYRLAPVKNIKNFILSRNHFLNNLNKIDMVLDIRGGDSFSDIYGNWYYLIESLPRICVLLLGKKYILMPQTYGPYKSFISKKIASMILKRTSFIFSRDLESINIVKKLLKNKDIDKINFCPDVAFVLESKTPPLREIKPLLDKNYKLIGLNISGLLYQKTDKKNINVNIDFNYEQFILMLLKRLIKNTNSHILLCPHTFGVYESDYYASNEILKKIPKDNQNRIHIINSQLDQSQVKGLIGMCDFFIGSRMHSCIAALSQGIPTIGVAYSKKFLGVFSTIGMSEYVINADKTTIESAIEKIIDEYNTSNLDKKNSLLQQVNEVTKTITQAFQIIFN